MAKSSNPKRKKAPKNVLKLPDLEQSKSAVLNSLVSSSSQRSYDYAIREFIEYLFHHGQDRKSARPARVKGDVG